MGAQRWAGRRAQLQRGRQHYDCSRARHWPVSLGLAPSSWCIRSLVLVPSKSGVCPHIHGKTIGTKETPTPCLLHLYVISLSPFGLPAGKQSAVTPCVRTAMPLDANMRVVVSAAGETATLLHHHPSLFTAGVPTGARRGCRISKVTAPPPAAILGGVERFSRGAEGVSCISKVTASRPAALSGGVERGRPVRAVAEGADDPAVESGPRPHAARHARVEPGGGTAVLVVALCCVPRRFPPAAC